MKEVSAEYRSGELLDACPVGYKQTEVGVIPDDWDVTVLDKLGAGTVPPIKAGPFGSSLTKNIYVSHGYKIYGQEQVIRGDHKYGDYYISEHKYRELQSCAVRAGDILLSLVGTAGKLLIITEDAEAGIINPRLLRFSFDRRRINSYFFKHLFESKYIQNVLERAAQGGTMAVLNAGMLRELEIPIPCFKEQTAIANALSDVDALIASLVTLITKKRAIKTAAMQQLLTGKKRLPPYDKTHTGYKQTELGEIPEDWEIHELGNIGAFTKGAGIKKDESNSGNIPCIRYGEIYTKHCDYIKTYSSYISESVARTATKLLKGDLLFAGSGETKEEIGKCVAFVDDLDAYAGGDIVILRPQWGDSLFLGYCLNSDYVVKQKSSKGQGDAVVHISANALRSVQVLLPSSQAEQQSIADVLLDMDKDIDALEKRLIKTQQLKQGMMQELLTGKTRLI